MSYLLDVLNQLVRLIKPLTYNLQQRGMNELNGPTYINRLYLLHFDVLNATITSKKKKKEGIQSLFNGQIVV